MKRGIFYGIGIGPGDPELLTLKAVKTIESCDVIAVPASGSSERTAMNIVEHYLHQKTLMECRFSMDHDEQKRIDRRRFVGAQICSVLESGRSVGFITLGDPSIYSTFTYVRAIVCDQGFEVVTVPGIASFSAVAASLNAPLCEGSEPLHILPIGGAQDVMQWIDLPGTKIFMKSGRNLEQVLQVLRSRGLAEQTQIVSRCTMPEERIFRSIDEFDRTNHDVSSDYFSVLIVREKKK